MPAWRCSECGSNKKPPYGTAKLCKECKSKRLKAGRIAIDVTCLCGGVFQAKSKNAKRCPACRESHQYQYKTKPKQEQLVQPSQPVQLVEPPEVTLTKDTKRVVDIKAKGVCQGKLGLMEEMSKIVEMLETWEAGEIEFAIYLRGK